MNKGFAESKRLFAQVALDSAPCSFISVLTFCVSLCSPKFGTVLLGFAQKVDPIWNEPVSTGNAGALARYEREARNIYKGVKKVEIERAAHAMRARAPALPVLAYLFLPHHSFGQGRFAW